MPDSRITLFAEGGRDAGRYAAHCDVVEGPPQPIADVFHLHYTESGMSLHLGEDARGVRVDADDLRRRTDPASALARAVGARTQPSVLDVMAGLGRDGLALAQLGCRVTLVERVVPIWALLDEFVHREQLDCQVLLGDGWQAMSDQASEVIYLDPMYPARRKKALPGKELQYLRALCPPQHEDASDAQWIAAARVHASRRVVLKRRSGAAEVVPPAWQLNSRLVRYDVYVPDAGSRADA